MRILDVINSTTSFFEKKGITSPRLQIELLLAHHLNLKRLDLYLQFERELSDAELEPLREMVKKRATGIPLQHITGVAAFYGRDFHVSPDVLIPRPETEQVVEATLGKLRGLVEDGASADKSKLRVLDMCTGSGIIGITLLLECPAVQNVTASDISEAALGMARKNAEKNLDDLSRIEFCLSDLFDRIQGSFDLIISNPPYIPRAVISTLSPEVQFDPDGALDGGDDGLDFMRKITEKALGFLEAGGWLVLEIGHDQGSRVKGLLENAGFRQADILPDMNGFDRIALGQKP